MVLIIGELQPNEIDARDDAELEQAESQLIRNLLYLTRRVANLRPRPSNVEALLTAITALATDLDAPRVPESEKGTR